MATFPYNFISKRYESEPEKGANKLKSKIILGLLILSSLLAVCATASATDSHIYTLGKISPADPVQVGDSVTMEAYTDNSNVDIVIFKWYAPGEDDPAYSESVTISPPGTCTSTKVVNQEGEWTVEVTFKNSAGTPIFQDEQGKVKYVKIGVGIDVFPLPEYPILGTAGVTAVAFGAFALFKRKEIAKKAFS